MSRGKELQLPQSRIRTIMKSSPDVENVGQDALHLVTKATELFIQHLTLKSHLVSKSKKLEYKEIAETVADSGNMAFLREVLPKKVTVEMYRKLVMEREKKKLDKKKKVTSESDG